MKYYFPLLGSLGFIVAVLGFGVLSGVAATICRILFVVLFIAAGIVLYRSSRVRKPVPSSFAASFKTEPGEPPAP